MGEATTIRRIRHVVADAYAFVRSSELNRELGAVTIEQLMWDHRRRLVGEDAQPNVFNPYEFDPEVESPAGSEPVRGSNFLGGVDTGLPTRKERILAIQNTLSAVISQVKEMGELKFESEPLDDQAGGIIPEPGDDTV